MKEALIIAQKDILIRLYDRFGFAFLIITPLVLTAIMGAAFGGEKETNFQIPVAIVNHDTGETGQAAAPLSGDLAKENPPLGAVLVDILTSTELSDILDPHVVENEAAARAAVKAGEQDCCLIIIPADFSRNVLLGRPAEVVVYSDPAREVSARIVESILGQVTGQLASGSTLFSVTIEQLFASGRISSTDQAWAVAQALQSQFQAGQPPVENRVSLDTLDAAGNALEPDLLAFLAPSMAILFLGFGASRGARSILAEEEMGTFARLNSTPISAASILLGKLLGALLGSAVQFGVLIMVGTLLFQLSWGNPLAVLILSIFVITAFTSLGLVMAVVARNEGQANTISNSVLLVFAIIGGNLVSPENFPAWLCHIAQITPNYWGVQGFLKLARAEGLSDLGPEILALGLITVGLLGLGLVLYRRRVTA